MMRRLAFLLFLGCAYFNAYYNACRLFERAEEERAQGRDVGVLYDQVIRKASKVIAFYPESRWVDDSLLLLGKALYRIGEYDKAARKFQELREFFPESELAEEARYWEGLALGEAGRREEALSVLLDLAEEEGRWSCRAMVALGDLYDDPEKALPWYGKALQCAKGSERFDLGLKLGRTYRRAGRPEEAERIIRDLLRKKPPRDLSGSLREELAEAMSDMERYEEALEIYKGLERGGSAEVLSGVGRVYARMGRPEEALKAYAEVVRSFPKTRQAVRARWESGMLLFRLGRWGEAMDAFEKALEEGVPCEEARKAREYGEKLRRWGELRARADSTGDVRDRTTLAEFLLLELSHPDSALTAYRQILREFPEDAFAPKALYAIGWILRNALNDTASADSAFRELLRRYPDSEPARVLREDGGRELFLRAERARLSGEPPEVFLPLYWEVLRRHPESPYASRAAYAVAWTYEHVLRDSLKALAAYQELAERFPEDETGRFARKKLSFWRADATAADSTGG
ncbi:MAG TPA: tetratricopeptide repeat protein [Candidatus Latescibacteria bacterium]|nr:tetratricopeptide repeat protein [Candidatus Latescibacterota bacterium]